MKTILLTSKRLKVTIVMIFKENLKDSNSIQKSKSFEEGKHGASKSKTVQNYDSQSIHKSSNLTSYSENCEDDGYRSSSKVHMVELSNENSLCKISEESQTIQDQSLASSQNSELNKAKSVDQFHQSINEPVENAENSSHMKIIKPNENLNSKEGSIPKNLKNQEDHLNKVNKQKHKELRKRQNIELSPMS